MAAVTLNTGSAAVTLTDGTALTFGATGYYCSSYRISPLKQDVEEFTANGVDGIGTKRHGIRDGNITLLVFAVRSSSGACTTGLIGIIEDQVSSGTIYYSVEGISGIGRIVGEQCAVEQPKNNGFSTYRSEAVIVIKRLRSS